MDLAIYISDISKYQGCEIEKYQFRFGDPNNQDIRKSYELIIKEYPNEASHLYFGGEFCENNIPTKRELDKFVKICMEDDLFPVFMTPPVTDYGTEKIDDCLQYLTYKFEKLAVVVNDLGVLELVNRKYPHIEVILGRILDKTSHDPRILAINISDYYGENGLKYARTPGNISSYSLEIMKKYSINRIEYDLPKTGIELLNNEMAFSLYWPFSYLTTGRVCLFESMYKQEKFVVGDRLCRHLCKKIDLELKKPLTGFQVEYGKKPNELTLFQKGNTVYFLNDKSLFFDCKKWFDRIVIQIL